MNPAIKELRELVGELVVWINWPSAVKGAARRWKHLRAVDMTEAYLAKSHRGNVGVCLGEVSDGLCAIDFDTDTYIEAFLQLNPHLAGTLQTFGARGRVFWVRFTGDYPRSTTAFKTVDGEAIGEFRSNGSQSIIWGIHPVTREAYRYVVKAPPVTVEFSSIKWPKEIRNRYA